jgi:molybdopterin molybdotransferase
MLMFEEYVRPALRRMLGFAHLHRPERMGILDAAWRKRAPDGRLNFLRVTTAARDGRLGVTLTGPQGSGLLASMMRTSALALMPPEILEVPAGGEVLLHLIDEPEDH